MINETTLFRINLTNIDKGLVILEPKNQEAVEKAESLNGAFNENFRFRIRDNNLVMQMKPATDSFTVELSEVISYLNGKVNKLTHSHGCNVCEEADPLDALIDEATKEHHDPLMEMLRVDETIFSIQRKLFGDIPLVEFGKLAPLAQKLPDYVAVVMSDTNGISLTLDTAGVIWANQVIEKINEANQSKTNLQPINQLDLSWVIAPMTLNGFVVPTVSFAWSNEDGLGTLVSIIESIE